ncbi:hypothetical protein KO481_21420 [Nocardia sp. NEAU-G5]|uniref:MFS transporter n=1 Tax=Nocardia albiluteola TaxID=2842303 RepID=A0ABS6B4E7_9NOCA|nr:hypothetical protein [Nocardia albiluteola]MBU3064079.1 hypothetical protein [Nocardia albiluteola]
MTSEQTAPGAPMSGRAIAVASFIGTAIEFYDNSYLAFAGLESRQDGELTCRK